MFSAEDFEDIRPYVDHEINSALRRIAANPLFDRIVTSFFPSVDPVQFSKTISSLNTSYEFQKYFMYPLAQVILRDTSGGFSTSGFDKLDRNTSYLFVANHRDIVLDSALLQMVLFEKEQTPMEITFGSNLMQGEFVIDIGKVNRMFRLERGRNKQELLRNSRITSAYIRHTLNNKKMSVWIAQRPGRTKDGDDRTETGLLKMFSISSCDGIDASLKDMRIVPVVISYEYEPCCASKIKELMIVAREGNYVKKPGEDLQSIICGITRQKGRIHMAVADPVNSFIDKVAGGGNINTKLSNLAGMIDDQVYRNYKLWPNNYIACDLLKGDDLFKENYTAAEKATFLEYMNNEVAGLEGDRTGITETFLRIYANPVINLNRIKL